MDLTNLNDQQPILGDTHEHVCPECGVKYPCGIRGCQHDEFKVCYPCNKKLDANYKCDGNWLFRNRKAIEPVIDRKLVILIASQNLHIQDLYDEYAKNHGLISYEDYRVEGGSDL